MGRYDGNRIFTSQEMDLIHGAKVCIIGCGGLGGYILEMLARVGVGEITVVDGDRFEESNLNRQIMSSCDNLGYIKVIEAQKRIEHINPEIVVHPIHVFMDAHNVRELIDGAHIVMDALDNIPSRMVLQKACEEEDIPLVHGAIAGWYANVTTVFPGDGTLYKLYPGKSEGLRSKGIEAVLGNPSFTPALAASIQVSECLKIVTGKGELLRHKIMHIDLLENDMYVIPIV